MKKILTILILSLPLFVYAAPSAGQLYYASTTYPFTSATSSLSYIGINQNLINSQGAPQLLSSFTSNNLVGAGWIRTYRDGYAFMTADSSTVGSSSLTTFVVASSTSPTQCFQSTDSRLAGAEGLEIAGNYLYVTSMIANTLTIWDISKPCSPVLVSSLQDNVKLNGAEAIVLDGHGTAYIAAYSNNSVTAVDVSNVYAPFVVSTFTNAAIKNPIVMKLYDRVLYVTNQGVNTFAAVNVSNRSAMSLASSVVVVGGVQAGFDIKFPYAYVAGFSNNMSIVDVSNPFSMTAVATSTIPKPWVVKIDGSTMFISSLTLNSIRAYDISSSTNPTFIGQAVDGTLLYGTDDIDVSGNRLFATVNHGGRMAILSIAGLTTPSIESGSILGNDIESLGNLKGNKVYANTSLLVGSGGITSNGTSTLSELNITGNLGIGTTSPWRSLSVNGSSDLGTNALSGSFTATSTTATSTFSGPIELANNTPIKFHTFSGNNLSIQSLPTDDLQINAVTAFIKLNTDQVDMSTAGEIDTQVIPTGGVVVGDWSPVNDVTNYLGRPNNRWNELNVGDINITGDATTNSILKVGGLEFQPYAVNNEWFGDNVYYNGNFTRRSDGAMGLFYFEGTEGQFRFYPSGAAGSNVGGGGGDVAQLKINANGTVAIGGVGSNVAGTFTNNTLLANGNGQVGIGSSTPWATLSVMSTTTKPFPEFVVASSTKVTHFIVDRTGNVGIGTTNPGSSLDVNGSVTFEGSSAFTSPSISGALVGIGCDTGDTTGLSGLASTTVFVTTPTVYPGAGVWFYTLALTSTSARTYVCSDVAVTPNASTYNVRIIK